MQRNRLYVNYAAALSILVLVVAVLSVVSSMGRISDSWRWVVHTREVLERLQGTQTLVSNADALQHSLLLQDDAQDRAEFTSTMAAIPREVASLRQLTKDNPVQQRALAAYGAQVNDYAQELLDGLARGADDRRELRSLRAAISSQSDVLRHEEARLLLLREEAVRRERVRLVASMAALAVLSVALLLLVRAIARRDARLMLAEQSRLDATLRSIGDAVIATGMDGRILLMNAVAERLTGITDAAAQGQPLADVLKIHKRGNSEADLSAIISEVVATRVPCPRIEISGSLPVEPLVIRDWILACYPMMSGYVAVGAVLSLLEVTELKASQRELVEANLLLERRVHERTEALADVNVELRAFAHTVAHDLRAPLRNVLGYANVLREDEAPGLSEQGRQFVDRIGVVAQRMDQLVTDLLQYSQLSRAEIRLGTVDLDRVIRLALDNLEAQVGASGAQVSVAGPLPPVHGNEAILVQVFDNLLSNAIKFVATGVTPQVRVAAETAGGAVRVRVSDNGIGIPAAKQETVFGAFERLHGEERYPGSGIGLAIVRKGLERIGGQVAVESSPAGSSFILTLPAAK
jgi:signal transduction histidine kinase/CHASE3 domain sensor protein